MEKAAVHADLVKIVPVPSRAKVQLILEIEDVDAQETINRLSYPISGKSVPVAVARLKDGVAEKQGIEPTPENRAKSRKIAQSRKWNEMSYAQRAGILCNNPQFRDWMASRGFYPNLTPEEYIRAQCRVASRADIDENECAENRFNRIHESFKVWKNYGLEAPDGRATTGKHSPASGRNAASIPTHVVDPGREGVT